MQLLLDVVIMPLSSGEPTSQTKIYQGSAVITPSASKTNLGIC